MDKFEKIFVLFIIILIVLMLYRHAPGLLIGIGVTFGIFSFLQRKNNYH